MEEKVAQSSRFRLKNALLSDKLKKSNYVNQCRSWSVCAMVFSNLIFLYLFLPVCLIAYFFCPGIRAKNAVLILFSLIFYAWGEPVYLLLMIASAAVNWYFGLLIERRRKKIFLILALVLDLGCLAVFKYAGFFVENLNAVFGASIPVPQIALPIGISFYTFQALSYTVDVWRGDVPAQRSFAKLLLYISLFPQLIAGPIVRYSDVAAQIDDRQFDASEAFYGATRFCIGLAKKVLLADAAGKVASQILDGSLASNTTVAAWLGILLYTFEIYFDFSGPRQRPDDRHIEQPVLFLAAQRDIDVIAEEGGERNVPAPPEIGDGHRGIHFLLHRHDAARAELRRDVRALRCRLFQRAGRHPADEQSAAAAPLRHRRNVHPAQSRQPVRRRVRAGRKKERADRLCRRFVRV